MNNKKFIKTLLFEFCKEYGQLEPFDFSANTVCREVPRPQDYKIGAIKGN